MPDKDDRLIFEAWWDPRSWGKKGKKGDDDEKPGSGVDPSDPDYLDVDQPDQVTPIKPLANQPDDQTREEPEGDNRQNAPGPTRIILPFEGGMVEILATQQWKGSWNEYLTPISVEHGIGFAETVEEGPFLTVSFTDEGISGAMNQLPGHSYFTMPGNDVLVLRSYGTESVEISNAWLINGGKYLSLDELKHFLIEWWQEFARGSSE